MLIFNWFVIGMIARRVFSNMLGRICCYVTVIIVLFIRSGACYLNANRTFRVFVCILRWFLEPQYLKFPWLRSIKYSILSLVWRKIWIYLQLCPNLHSWDKSDYGITLFYRFLILEHRCFANSDYLVASICHSWGTVGQSNNREGATKAEGQPWTEALPQRWTWDCTWR